MAKVSPKIKFDEYSSLVDMFEKTCVKFSSKNAFTNFGTSLTFNEIYKKSLGELIDIPQPKFNERGLENENDNAPV